MICQLFKVTMVIHSGFETKGRDVSRSPNQVCQWSHKIYYLLMLKSKIDVTIESQNKPLETKGRISPNWQTQLMNICVSSYC